MILWQQFLYVELKSIEEEMNKMDYKEKLPRSCEDLNVRLTTENLVNTIYRCNTLTSAMVSILLILTWALQKML